MAGAAALLAAAAVTISVIDLAKPVPPPTTTTVTAAPPAYRDDEVAVAKKEACTASQTVDNAVTSAQRAYVDTLPNRESPESKQALANFQTVMMVETEYLRAHTPPATPKDIAEAMNRYINALIGIVDAATRGLPDPEANVRIRDARLAGDYLKKACE